MGELVSPNQTGNKGGAPSGPDPKNSGSKIGSPNLETAAKEGNGHMGGGSGSKGAIYKPRMR